MKMTQLTQSTPTNLTGLLQEVQESLQAGRIDINQADVLQIMLEHCGRASCLHTLANFEYLNYLQPYFEYSDTGFTVQGFSYSRQQTPHTEKQKIAAALRQALESLEIDLREDDNAAKEETACE
jgi:hypothetical protein